ncbi:hemerythrin domain-containing protein [Mycetohabitans endofungorum]
MKSFLTMTSPPITAMIRLDHSHVLAAFRRYHPNSPKWRKRSIVESACIALEIHAQLEDEILYPALSRVAPDNDVLHKSEPEHNQMRETIRSLRNMDVNHPDYDSCFMQLIRETLHHVADEETVLLPLAERQLQSELQTLGASMTRRRIELLCERPMQVVTHTVLTFPLASAVVAGVAACAMGHLLCGGRVSGCAPRTAGRR